MNHNPSDTNRYSEFTQENEYNDLLIPFAFYREFQIGMGDILKKYIQEYCQDLIEIKIIEAGPGTGITTFELLKVDPRIKIVAVDNESKMIDILRAKFEKIPEMKDRVIFIQADILDFLKSADDESYDVFASVYTLHNFIPEHRVKVVGLLAQKLKSRGIFINGDKYARDEGHDEDFAAEILNHNKFEDLALFEEAKGNTEKAAYWRRLKAEGIEHAHKDNANRITVSEQNEILTRFGFTDIKWGKRYDLVTTVTALKK
jgi:ubiquinone/menaquinone biosynthesis C-methylase UbiE